MPLDTNIALSLKPLQLNDPLETQVRRQQIQANALTMRNAESQNALAQRAALEEQAVNKLYAQHYDPTTGRVDMNKVMAGAAQLGLGGKIPSMQTAALETEGKIQNIDKDKLANVSAAMDLRQRELAFVRTPEQMLKWSDDNHKNPFLKPWLNSMNIDENQSRASIIEAAKNPAAFADLLQKAQLGLKDQQAAVNQQLNRATQLEVQDKITQRMEANRTGRAAAPARATAGGGRAPASSSSAQSDAAVLAQAVSEGRLDPNRINSRSAPMLAATLRAAPGVNLVDVHATAATKSSPAIQARLAAFNALPDVIASVAEAGKKLNLSNLSPIGSLQVAQKTMTNDPDFRTYLAKRNDAVQAIAYAMRGVGMSDKATQLEERGAPVNMSPRAFDAWAKGQMDIIKARQKQNAPFEVNRKNAVTGGKPSLDDIFKGKK